MENNQPQIAAVYRRVSTNRQDASLEAQESRIQDYLKFKGLKTESDTVFFDEAVSGLTKPIAKRPGGSQLMNVLACGRIKHLVIAKLDRLGRKASDVLVMLDRLKELGVTIHIVDLAGDSLSTSGAAGEFMIRILVAVAELECEMIRTRIKDVLADKRASGKLVGTVPYGWNVRYTFAGGHSILRKRAVTRGEGKDAANAMADLEQKHGPLADSRLVDNDEEQHWIMNMARWHRDGMKYGRIGRTLNEFEVPTKQGGTWDTGNVKSVLNSKRTVDFLAGLDTSDRQAA